jgi:hypothetical protein
MPTLTKEELLLIALTNIVNDYDDAGCEYCGVVSVKFINDARKLLDMEPLTINEDDCDSYDDYKHGDE